MRGCHVEPLGDMVDIMKLNSGLTSGLTYR